MDISEVKDILRRRMKSAESALEDSDNSDEIRHYYRGMKMGLESIYYELLDKDEVLNGTKPKNPKNSSPKVFLRCLRTTVWKVRVA